MSNTIEWRDIQYRVDRKKKCIFYLDQMPINNAHFTGNYKFTLSFIYFVLFGHTPIMCSVNVIYNSQEVRKNP